MSLLYLAGGLVRRGEECEVYSMAYGWRCHKRDSFGAIVFGLA